MKDVHAREQAFLDDLFKGAIVKGALKPFDTGRMALNLIALSESIKKNAKEKYPDGKSTEAIGQEIAVNIDFMLALIFEGLRI